MKLALIGNYGATNIGDEAILDAILKSHPGHRFTVFSARPEETAKRHRVKTAPLFPCGFRSFFRYGFRAPLRALKEARAVVLGGGGLLQDDRRVACLIWAWQVFWVRRLGKPLFIYGTGVGPLRTRLGKKLARYVYRYASRITVRDNDSAVLLKKLGVSPQKITVTADPVFLIRIRRQKTSKERTKNLFIISLRPWKTMTQDKLDTLTIFTKWLKESQKATILFVAMQQVKEADHFVLNRFNEQIFYPKNFSELLQKMLICQAAFGMRYHFGIAAFLTGTPCLALSYSPKVSALFDRLAGQRVELDGRLTPDRLKILWRRLMREGVKTGATMRKQAGILKTRAQKNVDLLEEFLHSGDE